MTVPRIRERVGRAGGAPLAEAGGASPSARPRHGCGRVPAYAPPARGCRVNGPPRHGSWHPARPRAPRTATGPETGTAPPGARAGHLTPAHPTHRPRTTVAASPRETSMVRTPKSDGGDPASDGCFLADMGLSGASSRQRHRGRPAAAVSGTRPPRARGRPASAAAPRGTAAGSCGLPRTGNIGETSGKRKAVAKTGDRKRVAGNHRPSLTASGRTIHPSVSFNQTGLASARITHRRILSR